MSKNYAIHQMLLSQTSKRMKKTDRKYKRLSSEECIGKICKFQETFTNTLDFSIMAQECYWKSNDCNILFPDGSEMLDKLYSAKFDIEGNAGFDLPFDSFMIGIPHGYEIDGQPIPPMIVTYMEYNEMEYLITQSFAKKCALPPLEIGRDEAYKGKMMLSVAYQDPYTPCTAHMMKCIDELPQILNANTLEEYEALVKFTMQKEGVIKLDETDLKLQFKMFRLIASLGVYHVATKGEKLKSGFPDSGPFQVQKPKEVRPNFYSYSIAKTNSTSPTEHVRGWTFRQLRDERYYRNEYANMEKGSRWVFVDACTVGTKSTPFTQS